MKTSVYNKEEHLEGYVGTGKKPADKSEVQQEYEKGNDTNEVKSFGKELHSTDGSKEFIPGNVSARDGFDNSGTQGKDSLSDDTYNSTDQNPTIERAESHTGSSSEDFKDIKGQRDEDDILNTGI